MVTPQFTETVTLLRDRYLHDVDKRQQEKGRLPIGERLAREIAVERGMLPVGTEAFLEFYLHPDGRLLFYNTLMEEVWEQRGDQWSLALGLRIGSRRYPELEKLLPPPPRGAVECVDCGGAGCVSAHSETAACWKCSGLGWLPGSLVELCEQMTAEFRSARGDLQQIIALARRFFREASAVLGTSRATLAYLDTVLRRAGFDNEQVAEIGEIAEPYLDDVRQRDDPQEVSATRVLWEQFDDPPGQTNTCTINGQPFTGVAYSTFEDGTVFEEWTIRGGRLWGPYRDYSPEGRLTTSGYVVARIRHGVWRNWYRDGRKRSVESVQYGVTVRRKCWDKNGEASSDDVAASEWHRKQMQENRRKFGLIIDAEPIPEDYTHLGEEDWL